jgi:polar amino acid transport system substrate-binding protein
LGKLGNKLGFSSSRDNTAVRKNLILNFSFSLGLSIGLVTGNLLTVAPIAEAAELEEIQQRGYLIVAVKDNVPPLGFRDEAGELAGLEVDLARRLAQELLGSSDAVVLQPVANQERLSAVLQGEVDMAIARVTVTASRSRVIDFSLPYYLDGTALITLDPAVQQFADLRGQTIAVLNGSSTISVVRSRLPSVRLIGVESYQAAQSLLESREAIAFAADASVLSGWVQENSNYHLLPTLLSAEALSVVMPRGVQYDDLRRRVNEAIARLHEEGWLEERATYWGLP